MVNTEVHIISSLVKDELLEIYQAYADVCKRHGLKQWIAYGTMLGAVRHKGFIPWDDDFDVFMMRDDYEKFFAIAEQELPSYFKPVTYHNCKEYPAMFGKVQETRRDVYERIERDAGYVNPHGLYIDVFPLDGAPTQGLRHWQDVLKAVGYYCLDSCLFRHNGHNGLIGCICDCIGGMLKPFYGTVKKQNDFARLLDEFASSYPIKEYEHLRYFELHRKFRRHEIAMPRNAFEETILLPFEDLELPVPAGYDTILRLEYGPDYMTPPPMEKRVSEHSKSDKASWYYGPDEQ